MIINKIKAKKFLLNISGLSGELFYVRDGHVNEYAMNFIVLVPASMNVLTFNWQSYSDKPVRNCLAIIIFSIILNKLL